MLSKLLVVFCVLSLVELVAPDETAHGQYTAQFQSAGTDALGATNESAQAEAPHDDPNSYVANLTDTEHLTNWAKARAKDSKWGYTIYRTYYSDDEDENEWNIVISTFQEIVLASLQSDATYDGLDHDPHNVKDRIHFDVVNDASIGLSGAPFEAVRERFQEHVLQDYQGPKLGGFKWGGYLKLDVGQGVDGMALNQALVVDESSFYSLLNYNPEQSVYDAEAGESPPHVVAVDACHDPETFTPMTSWTQEYEGWYRVPVELLMLDFYEVTYEARPMEHFAPKPDDLLNIFGMSWAGGEDHDQTGSNDAQ